MMKAKRVRSVKFPPCRSVGLTAGFLATVSIVAWGAVCLPARAQTFTGNTTTSGPFSTGWQYFYDTSTLNASAANAVSGGLQRFYNLSTLNASAANAVSGGQQRFYNSSALNASVANAVSGGEQHVFDTSTLNASAANAISGGRQFFYGTSALNASVANAISGGIQTFYDASTLNASVANAISGGKQSLSFTSMLNASVANAISGGEQTFYSTSALNASAANAVSGGTQTFYEESVLNVQATNALTNTVNIRFNNSSGEIGNTGGILKLNGYSTVIGAINSLGRRAGAGIIENGGASDSVLTVDSSMLGNSSFSGLIRDGGAGKLAITKTGAGLLTLTGANSYTGGTTIDDGTLALGAGGSLAATGAMRLSGAASVFDISAATANQTIGSLSGIAGSKVLLGGNTLSFGDASNQTFGGVVSGTGGLTKQGSGIQTLTGANTYTGATTITAGLLQGGADSAFSAASAYTVQSGGTLDANGFVQTLASLNNSGMVATNLKADAVGTTLTVAGDYTGNGGTVFLNTELNGDNSATDRLHIRGNSAGQSQLVVRNVGGSGAQTVEGIRVIEVDGNSGAEFALSGDYVIEGQQAVVGGAYAYTLHKNGVSAPNDGAWYLRSQLKNLGPDQPLYQAGVPVYEAYPQALLALNTVSTMQQRLGNRLWRTGAQSNADIASRTDPNTGSWVRLEGAAERYDPTRSSSMTSYDVDRYKMQGGVDALLRETASGRLFGGLNLHYSNGRTKVSSVYGNGRINTDGYGVGASLTWYGDNGVYIDNQAQVTFYDSKLASTTAARTLVHGNDGTGYVLSTEVGRRYAISPGWTVTPQAQVMYSKVSFDDFTDTFGTAVTLDKGKSVRGRLGLSLDYESAGQGKRMRSYGIVNLYNEFLDGTRVDVAGTAFASANERLWGGIGVGTSYSWADGKYTVYGEGSANTSLNRFGDSYAIAGNVGVRIAF